MKYLLTTLKSPNNTHLSLLEDIIPAKTSHIRGYGFGVTFTSKCSDWAQSPTFQNIKLLTILHSYCCPSINTVEYIP
jgi:hypothetical protein